MGYIKRLNRNSNKVRPAVQRKVVVLGWTGNCQNIFDCRKRYNTKSIQTKNVLSTRAIGRFSVQYTSSSFEHLRHKPFHLWAMLTSPSVYSEYCRIVFFSFTYDERLKLKTGAFGYVCARLSSFLPNKSKKLFHVFM